MKKFGTSALASLLWTALFTATVAPAYAQEPIEEPAPPAPRIVNFTNITDAAPGVCYNAADTAADPTNENALVIGVHSGLNPANWSNTACIASTAAFHARQVSDTIAARVEVAEGYCIAGVTFTQDGNASALRLGQVFAGAQWVVDGYPAIASIDGASASFEGGCRTSVDVSFSIFLGAKAPPSSGSASASVSNPRLVVEVAPATTP